MTATLHCGDCREVLPSLPDNSVDLILTDPPYFRVKSEAWDRQWDKPERFLEWLDGIAAEWQRVLRPNGSLYCFASPKMAARVEVMIGRRFNVLSQVVWSKTAHRGGQAEKESLRSWWPESERIIFAEHFGSDNIAKGEAGYVARCDELRGFVFEPIRSYLDGERRRAGVPHRTVIAHLGMGGHDTHFFSQVQWKLPLREQYEAMRSLFNANGGEHLRREYEYLRREYEDLRREYEDLRREYEDLRRPFSVSADVPYTDVWTFPTVSAYPGKHPCEKPQALLRHVIAASSRPGAVVLDCFMGCGSTGEAALALGRRFVGIEKDLHYFGTAKARLASAGATETTAQAGLFEGAA